MKKLKIISLVFILCVMFCGCRNSNLSISNRDIVQGVGIDTENGKTKVTVQALDLIRENSGADSLSGNLTYIITGYGYDITSAVSSASKRASKDMLLGQNKIVVLSKETVKEDLKKNIDYLLRAVDSRGDVLIALAEKDASDIIKCTQNDALVPAESISKSIYSANEKGYTCKVSVKDLVNAYSNETDDIFLPVLSSGTEKEKSVCEINGVAIFSKDKAVKILNDEETRGMMFLKNKLKDGDLSFYNEDFGNVSLELIESSPKQKVFVKDGKVFAEFTVKGKYFVNEVEKGLVTDVTDKVIEKLQKVTNEKIETLCKMALNATYKNGCDVFQTGRKLSFSDRKIYDTHKDNWNEFVKSIDFSVKSECEVIMINDNSIKE
ncbi:MAG: hypothetical protein DBY14_01080 [Escherichia coli]|nr:MAG: hypothetical protein DBY14_01080 [Escherichia coli]